MSPRTTAQNEIIREERKAQILDAALHVFAEEGYHSASVSKVAKRAEISKGLIYNYFHSKEEVLRALIIDLFDYAMNALKMKPEEVISDERFKEIIELSIYIPLQEPQRWKLYMSLVFQQNVAELLMSEMEPRMGPFMQQMMVYFQGKGYEDPMSMMRVFSATLDGIQMHCLLDPKNFPAKKAQEYLINQFV
ncbi:TetR/AcrR family transcriptional regulator [Salibacteraceae bacterium]|jgi:AcrR family transcriptional regulator|nr:TetR/AcrR family transcriptional regulator [Salibacteraceae bacterium]